MPIFTKSINQMLDYSIQDVSSSSETENSPAKLFAKVKLLKDIKNISSNANASNYEESISNFKERKLPGNYSAGDSKKTLESQRAHRSISGEFKITKIIYRCINVSRDGLVSLYEKVVSSHPFILTRKEVRTTKRGKENEKFRSLFNKMISAVETEKLYLDPKLTQDDVIRHLGTNRKYLYTALKNHCDKNFKGLLNFYRVKHAKFLLKDKIESGEKYSLSDVYVDCGFSTNESFYRTFKNVTGISPGRYVAQFKS